MHSLLRKMHINTYPKIWMKSYEAKTLNPLEVSEYLFSRFLALQSDFFLMHIHNTYIKYIRLPPTVPNIAVNTMEV